MWSPCSALHPVGYECIQAISEGKVTQAYACALSVPDLEYYVQNKPIFILLIKMLRSRLVAFCPNFPPSVSTVSPFEDFPSLVTKSLFSRLCDLISAPNSLAFGILEATGTAKRPSAVGLY